MESYDLVVIGGGSGGYAAARTGAALGLRVAVIEGGEELGGLCILRGCMPSKTLIESANRYRTIRRAAEFGLRAGGHSPDMAAIVARKRLLVKEFADYRAGQLTDGRFALIRGRARFVSRHEVAVALRGGGEETVTGRAFVIATGSRHALPPVAGLAETPHLTSDEALELETLPESLIVLGGGAVALEMAHYFDALGSQVSLIQRSAHVLSAFDADIGRAVEEAFRARGMRVETGTRLKRVEAAAGGGVSVTFSMGGTAQRIEAAALLCAMGRAPATDGLGLEEIGVALDRGRIVVDEAQRASLPHVFAAGDVCGPDEVVHVAVQQGEVAAVQAARFLGAAAPDRRMDYRIRLFAAFCEPQAAVAGLGEEEAARQGISVRAASYPFDDHGKSIVASERHGFVKLVAEDGSGKILGGAAVGPEASELIHEIAVAMHFHATAADLAAVPHYHPTLSEIWTYPAEELAGL